MRDIFSSAVDAQAFKEAFEKAQEDNSKAPKSESAPAPAPAAEESKKEDVEEKTEGEKVGPLWRMAF